MAKRIDSIGGVKVLLQQQSYGPNPHPDHRGKLTPFTNVVHLVLDNGDEYHACEICGKPFDRPEQAAAHLASHARAANTVNNMSTEARDNVHTIRDVIRTVRTIRENGAATPWQKAADDLNRRKIRPIRGKTWSGQKVYHLYTKYNNVVQVRRIPQQRTASSSAPMAVPVTTRAITPTSVNPVTALIKQNAAINDQDQIWLTNVKATIGDVGEMVKSVDGSWHLMMARLDGISTLLLRLEKLIAEVQQDRVVGDDVTKKAVAYDSLIEKLNQFGMKIDH